MNKPQPSTARVDVSPDPVRVGDNWTLGATGLPPHDFVNVMIADDVGTTAFFLQVNEFGLINNLTWHSYWPGVSTVRIEETDRKRRVLATTTFTVTE